MRTLTVAHWAASRATNVEHLFPAKSMELAWPARRAGKTVRELCASSLPGSDPGIRAGREVPARGPGQAAKLGMLILGVLFQRQRGFAQPGHELAQLF